MMKARSILNISDVLIFIGLASIGVGLFLCFGMGYALVGVGALMLAIGFFGR